MNNKELLQIYFKEYKHSFLEKASKLHQRIRGNMNSSVEAFNTIFAGLSLYCNINETQIENSITDGNNDYSIDAIYIPQEKDKNITIFDFKGNDKLDYEEIKKYIGYLEKYILDGNDLPRDANEQLNDKLKNLHSELSITPQKKIDIVIYRELEIQENKLLAEKNRLEYLKLKYERIGSIDIISKKQIYELLLKKLRYEGNVYSKGYDNFKLFYDNNNIIKINNELLIVLVPLFNLLQFTDSIEKLNDGKTNNRKYDIFKLNVRRANINSIDIRSNIIETVNKYPENFINYHNGITITCENFNKTNDYIQFEHPQIVNGCQTISGLYEEFKTSIQEYEKIITGKGCNLKNKDEIVKSIQNVEKLKTAKIAIKIVIAEGLSEEPKKISKFANSQTEVKAKELISNNIEQLVIGNYLRLKGFNYYRKEGQEIDKTKKTITMEQIYKFMYGYLYLDPSRGKEYLNTILFKNEKIYNSLFPGIFKLEDILKISEFYKKVHEFKKRNYGISKYYDDFLVFGLFLIYKEAGNSSEIKPSTIRDILDDFLKIKSETGKYYLEREIYINFFQRRTKDVVTFLIERLEKKYSFILDNNKFVEYKKLLTTTTRDVIAARIESMGLTPYISYKGFNFKKLNNYLSEKQENKKNFKNLIWIIIDVLEDNGGKIVKDDLIEILKKVKKNINIDYIDKIINKNNDKIQYKENIVSLLQEGKNN